MAGKTEGGEAVGRRGREETGRQRRGREEKGRERREGHLGGSLVWIYGSRINKDTGLSQGMSLSMEISASGREKR